MTPEQAEIGRAVVYHAHPDARPEDGRITSVHAIQTGVVHVLYDGDNTAKATRLVDLEPLDARTTSYRRGDAVVQAADPSVRGRVLDVLFDGGMLTVKWYGGDVVTIQADQVRPASAGTDTP
jgi:hypothetical protein